MPKIRFTISSSWIEDIDHQALVDIYDSNIRDEAADFPENPSDEHLKEALTLFIEGKKEIYSDDPSELPLDAIIEVETEEVEE